MNHYDALIRDYLYEFKSVSFEKIGELVLDSSVSADQPIQENSIHFTVNKRAITTPDLAGFIVTKTGKSKVLISSDLESFVELMRQFMNIGKPYEMEGVGIFKLGKGGEYEFAAFDETHKREETRSSRKQKSRTDSPLSVKNSSNRSLLMFFALIIILGVLGVIGWGSYKLFVNNKNNTPPQIQNTSIDSTAQINPPPKPLTDSAAIQPDSLQKKDSVTLVKNDSATYKFIYEITTSSVRAYERMNSLKSFGHPSSIDSVKRDSSTVYTLYFKYRLSNADTALMRDSIQKLLNRKIRIKPF